MTKSYSCSYESVNGAVTEKCGPFVLYYSEDNPRAFRIESNFSSCINSQIKALIIGRGITIAAGFDMTPALIKWLIDEMPHGLWKIYEPLIEKKPVPYNVKVIIVAHALNNLILNADIKTLNLILKDFIKDKFGG